jgi:hypothetical protein
MYDTTLWCICHPLFNCFKNFQVCDSGNTVLITKCEFHFLLKLFLPSSDKFLVVILSMCPEIHEGVHINHLSLMSHSYLLLVNYREDKKFTEFISTIFGYICLFPIFLLPVYICTSVYIEINV